MLVLEDVLLLRDKFSGNPSLRADEFTSNQIFRSALKDTPIIVGNLDRDLRFTWVFNLQSGYKPEDVLGKKFGTGMYFENMSNILECFNRVIEKGVPMQTMVKGKGPEGERVFDFYIEPKRGEKGEITGASFTALNITEHKKAEEALRESEKRFNRSQEIAHLGSWELDLTTDQLSWSDEVYRIFGMKPKEFGATYEAFLDAVHPDDRAAVDAAYSGSLREGKDTYEIEHRVVRKSTGEIRIVHEKCEHIRDESGRIVRSIGMVHDITERKKAEEEIERLASFPALNPDPVAEVDFDGNIEYVNAATKTMFPDLETLGLYHPFLSGWEIVVKTFRDEKVNTFGREVKIGEHWYHQQFSLVPKNKCIRIYAEL